MEKTIDLNMQEQQLLGTFENERQQALAMYGALTMDRKTAKKNLEAALEKQRAFLRSTLITKGYGQYENARLVNNNTGIQIVIPDEEPTGRRHANGPAKLTAEK
jgi:hypothetical protein